MLMLQNLTALYSASVSQTRGSLIIFLTPGLPCRNASLPLHVAQAKAMLNTESLPVSDLQPLALSCRYAMP